MRLQRCRPAAIAALCLVVAGPALADGFSARDGGGAKLNLRGHTLGTVSGNPDVLPQTGLADAAGNDLGNTANPLRTAPGIAPATPYDRGGSIAVAGVAQTAMAGNPSRKGGWIVGDPNNTGYIYVSYTGIANTTPGAGKQCIIGPAGGSCPLTINGYVIQNAISIAGTVQGDAYAGLELQ